MLTFYFSHSFPRCPKSPLRHSLNLIHGHCCLLLFEQFTLWTGVSCSSTSFRCHRCRYLTRHKAPLRFPTTSSPLEWTYHINHGMLFVNLGLACFLLAARFRALSFFVEVYYLQLHFFLPFQVFVVKDLGSFFGKSRYKSLGLLENRTFSCKLAQLTKIRFPVFGSQLLGWWLG